MVCIMSVREMCTRIFVFMRGSISELFTLVRTSELSFSSYVLLLFVCFLFLLFIKLQLCLLTCAFVFIEKNRILLSS